MNRFLFPLTTSIIIVLASFVSCSACYKHVYYAKKSKSVYDSLSINTLKTCTMKEIERVDDCIASIYGFEFWYESSDLEKDMETLTTHYKQETRRISTNKDMPLFWSLDWGNRWVPLAGQYYNAGENAWYYTLPNRNGDNGGDIDERGQIWNMSIRSFKGKYIRVVFRFDNLKVNGVYYQYDQGVPTDIKIHYNPYEGEYYRVRDEFNRKHQSQ